MRIEAPNLTSVVSYPERGEGGSNKYRGNCSPKLIEDLLAHFQVSQVCDYMCGSNTTQDAARNLGLTSHTYDLHSGFDLLNHDIPERSEFTFWHPPYWSIITYSDVMYSASQVRQQYGFDPRLSDLSRIPTWEKFVEAMNVCMLKQFCALDKGGRMAVLVGDIKKKGRLYSMIFELLKPGKVENVLIKMQHNCVSDKNTYSGKLIPIVHEYVLIVRKEAPLVYQMQLTQSATLDIRDMPGVTWRDVLADVMANATAPLTMDEIYAQVKDYKRAQATSWWQEKVRQTLYTYPKLFERTSRGVWRLCRMA